MKKLILVIAICIVATITIYSQTRYVSRVFEETQILSDVVYSNADSWDAYLNGINYPEDILLDVYMPVEDGDNLRPTVVCLFGGAFLAGSKDMRPDILAWCDSLSHFGYVAVAIDYRIGFNPASGAGGLGPAHGMKRAAWRAIQDCNSALDFLKENFLEYRIDTNQIFLLGNSAGSITAINTVFLTDEERLPETYEVGTGANNVDLGFLNENSFFPNHTNCVAGVVGLWGGTMDLNWFDEDEQVPMLFIHGDDDEIVPHDEGFAFNFGAGTDINVYLYGSIQMNQHFQNHDWESELHIYPNQPHAFYSCGDMNMVELERENFPCEQWGPVFNQVITWLSLHNQYYLYSQSMLERNSSHTQIFPNPVIENICISSDKFEIGEYQIYDATGRVVLEDFSSEKAIVIDAANFSSGLYFFVNSSNKIEKFIVQ
ncbi:MAG: T9SS type A sorting domain-containing protein [Bacteroidales bacterium]|nr:T9SS type A sorting domain-containing protein [Bacteroidales bacterium]